MKNLLQTMVVLVLMQGLLTAQIPTVEWSGNYGGSFDDEARSFAKTSDGGYILMGVTHSIDIDAAPHTGYEALWVCKTNAAGNIQWKRTFGNVFLEDGREIIQTAEGGYILVGDLTIDSLNTDTSVGGTNIWVVKLDALGNTEWEDNYGGMAYEYGTSICQLPGGGYILAGTTKSTDGDVTGLHGDRDIWIVKLDALGNIDWQKCMGGSALESVSKIIITADGGYLFAGYTESSDGDVSANHGIGDAWVVKLDNSGNIEWEKTFGSSDYDYFQDVKQTGDMSFILAGTSAGSDGDLTNNHGFGDAWMVKIDATGGLLWQKSMGGSSGDGFLNLIFTHDGGYLFTGGTYSNDHDVTGNHSIDTLDAWMVKVDSTGLVEWQKCLGGKRQDMGVESVEISPGKYMMLGTSKSNEGDLALNYGTYNLFDIWMLKVGLQYAGVEEEESKFRVYPNPSQGEVWVETKDVIIDQLILTNVFGQVLKQQTGNGFQQKMMLENLPPGMYLMTLQSGEERFIKNILLQ